MKKNTFLIVLLLIASNSISQNIAQQIKRLNTILVSGNSNEIQSAVNLIYQIQLLNGIDSVCSTFFGIAETRNNVNAHRISISNGKELTELYEKIIKCQSCNSEVLSACKKIVEVHTNIILSNPNERTSKAFELFEIFNNLIPNTNSQKLKEIGIVDTLLLLDSIVYEKHKSFFFQGMDALIQTANKCPECFTSSWESRYNERVLSRPIGVAQRMIASHPVFFEIAINLFLNTNDNIGLERSSGAIKYVFYNSLKDNPTFDKAEIRLLEKINKVYQTCSDIHANYIMQLIYQFKGHKAEVVKILNFFKSSHPDAHTRYLAGYFLNLMSQRG